MEAQLFQAKMTEIDPPPDRATAVQWTTEPRLALALCAAPPLPSLGPAPKASAEVRVAAGAAHKPLLSAVPRASNMTSGAAEFDLGVRRARCVATRASLCCQRDA